MDSYLPADNRASTTLTVLLEPFMTPLFASENIKDIVRALTNHLPFGIAHEAELRMRMNRAITEITARKQLVAEIVRNLIIMNVCRGSPFVTNENEGRQFYYMKEEIVRWYESNPTIVEYFSVLPQETITIEVSKNNIVKTSNLTLGQDQMIGIAYALNGLKDHHIQLKSSITGEPVAVSDIADHALVYRLPITLATEEIKRPYRVDILQATGAFLTTHFITPEFMQGVLSVAYWAQLPNNGKDTLWKDLYQFTRDGLIPLEF